MITDSEQIIFQNIKILLPEISHKSEAFIGQPLRKYGRELLKRAVECRAADVVCVLGSVPQVD